MTAQAPSTRPNRPTRPGTPPVGVGGGSATIDPIRVLRQHLVLLISTGVVGLVLGVGVYVVWLVYMPSYTGVATFEMVAELGSADEAVGRENRNEDTIQRIAGTEAARAVSEEYLRSVLNDSDIETLSWVEQFREQPGKAGFKKDEALIELMDEISASYRRRTQFFDIRWSAKDPKDVPVMLEAVKKEYMRQRAKLSDEDLTEAKEPFVDQLNRTEININLLEDEISTFIKTNNLLSLDQSTGTLQADLEDRELERNEVLSELETSAGMIQQIDAKLMGTAEPSQDDIQMAESDPVVLRALTDIQTLRGLVAEHRQKFGPGHTQVRESQRALDARIREKDRKVEEVVFRNLQALKKLTIDNAERLGRVEVQLTNEIEAQSERLTDFVAALADLKKKESQLQRYEERRLEIQSQIDGIDAMFSRLQSGAQVRPVGTITTPLEPSSPMWYIAIPGTAFLLLAFVGGVVFLKEALDKRVRSTADITALPGLRLLGIIPDLRDDPTDVSRAESVIRDSPASVMAENHRQFAAAFRRAREDVGARSVLFVGGLPESGTTSIAANLAVIAATSGRKVALVDGNLRRPRMAEVFGLDPDEPGLGDVICGEASVESVMQTSQEGIQIVTAGRPEHRTFERLDAEHLRSAIDALAKHVDVVFVDGPPAVVAGEAMGMADQVDATVLVVRAYSEQRGLVARLSRQLREQPSAFLGVVLNRPRNTAGGYFKRNYEAIASYANEKD